MKDAKTILKEYQASTNKFLTDEQISDLQFVADCHIKKHRKISKENCSDDLTYEANFFGYHKSFIPQD